MPSFVFSLAPSRFQMVMRLELKRMDRERPQRSSPVFRVVSEGVSWERSE